MTSPQHQNGLPETGSPKLSVASLAAGIFLVVSAEQLPIGLLTQIAVDLNVTKGTAGLAVSVPGIVAGLSAPAIALVGHRLDRRSILGLSLLILSVSSVASAYSSSFSQFLVARFFVGISIGCFWAIAGSIAPRLVPSSQVPRALSLIFGGVAAASVLGVPVGTMLGNWWGWRLAFGAFGAISAIATASLLLAMPRIPSVGDSALVSLVNQLRAPRTLLVLAVTVLVITAQFASYAYISPIAQDVMHIPISATGPLLLGYGVFGMLGNFFIGTVGARHHAMILLVICVILAVLTASMAVTVNLPVLGTVIVLLWGAIFGGVSVTLQAWILDTAKSHSDAATSLLVCAFNLSIALGAFLGGHMYNTVGLVGVSLLSTTLFTIALPAIAIGRKSIPQLTGRRDEEE